jgi:hypothetical protein
MPMATTSITARTKKVIPVTIRADFNPLILYITKNITNKISRANKAYRIVKDIPIS